MLFEKYMRFILLANVYLIGLVNSFNKSMLNSIKPENIEVFLQKYGYLTPRVQPATLRAKRSSSDQVSISEAIKRYQTFYQLPSTNGDLDSETLAHMTSLRCGTPDVFPNNEFALVRSSDTSYQLFNESIAPRFPKRSLSWKITQYPTEISQNDVNYAIKEALTMWSDVCNLNFYQTTSDFPDIELKFQYPSVHNQYCSQQFVDESDLGHFVPGSLNPSKTHYNDIHQWKVSSIGESNKQNLIPIIAHEIGHSLGLAHTRDRSSIMYPHYNPDVYQLSADDIAGCRARYGSPSDESPNSPMSGTCPDTVTKYYINKDSKIDRICAIVYTEPRCQGDALNVLVDHQVSDLKESSKSWTSQFGNAISSAEINPDCVLTLCSRTNFQGNCLSFGGGSTGRNYASIDSNMDNYSESLFCFC